MSEGGGTSDGTRDRSEGREARARAVGEGMARLAPLVISRHDANVGRRQRIQVRIKFPGRICIRLLVNI